MSVTLKDMLIPGKPSMVHCASASGAEMKVKETAWQMGHEPRLLDLEFATPCSLSQDWSTYNTGDLILAIEARNAEQDTQEAFVRLMRDPDKIVVVATSAVPEHMPVDKFSFYGKF